MKGGKDHLSLEKLLKGRMKFPPPFYKALGPSPALDVTELLSMGRLVKHQSLLSCCLDDKKSPTVKHKDAAGQVRREAILFISVLTLSYTSGLTQVIAMVWQLAVCISKSQMVLHM